MAAIMARIHEQSPLSAVIDIGPGQGTYLHLLKELLPGVRWTGVEVWGPYAEEFQLDKVYDQVCIADVRYLDLAKFPTNAAMICGDMLEHMSKADALEVLNAAVERFKLVLVSIPIGEWPQEAIGGNVFETHQASWSKDDIETLMPDLAEYHYVGTDEAVGIAVAFMSRDPKMVDLIRTIFSRLMPLMSENPGLFIPPLDICPAYHDPFVQAIFHGYIRQVLGHITSKT